MMATESMSKKLSVLVDLTKGYPGNFLTRLWDGSTWEPNPGAPADFTVVLRHPGALRAMFWPFSKISLGEAYIFGDCDIEGNMLAAARWMNYLGEQVDRCRVWEKIKLLWIVLSLPRHPNPHDRSRVGRLSIDANHSKERDRAAVSFTYDYPCELYQLFLDKNMQYTCGYFAQPDEELETAQERKMDYICRKLRLRPGQRLLDMGCGWGGLAIHAARCYGVEVVGVTLSHVQAQWAQRAVAEAGLQNRVRIVECDYRDFREPAGFDKACCVGMAEHVGVKNIPTLYGKIFELLKPGGAFAHQCITLRPGSPYPRWQSFAWKYVFPNGELPAVTTLLDDAAEAGFEIRDVESLREHYILTLEHWVRRLEANHDRALEWTDEVGFRIFRLYLAGATLGFHSGIYNLNHCLVIKPDAGRSGLPLTRADWFAECGAEDTVINPRPLSTRPIAWLFRF